MRRQVASDGKHVAVTSSQFLVFASEASGTNEVRYEDGTIWLTQKLMAQLFDVDVRTTSEHLGNIDTTGELVVEATIRKFRIVRTEGSRQGRRVRARLGASAQDAAPGRICW